MWHSKGGCTRTSEREKHRERVRSKKERARQTVRESERI